MENRNVSNLAELKAEITRVRLQQFEQEAVLHQHVEDITEKLRTPIKVFDKLGLWVKHDENASHGAKAANPQEHQDWVTAVLRLGLPFAINKFFLPKSGFLMKTLVTLASQKAAANVNKDLITEWTDKITGIFKSKGTSRRKSINPYPDYGIPPDSETY